MIRFALITLIFSTQLWAENMTKIHVELSPAGSFDGVSQKMKGDLVKKGDTLSSDKLWVNAESFKTGIDLRDEHLWKHLKSSKIIMTNVKGTKGRATGVLEINNVKKTVNMTYAEKNGHVNATFTLLASEFQLPKASYMGVGVEDSVRVDVTYPIKQQ
jgi:hypothetical protein